MNRKFGAGAPIASVMSSVFGWPFVLSYVLSYMLVSMGATALHRSRRGDGVDKDCRLHFLHGCPRVHMAASHVPEREAYEASCSSAGITPHSRGIFNVILAAPGQARKRWLDVDRGLLEKVKTARGASHRRGFTFRKPCESHEPGFTL